MFHYLMVLPQPTGPDRNPFASVRLAFQFCTNKTFQSAVGQCLPLRHLVRCILSHQSLLELISVNANKVLNEGFLVSEMRMTWLLTGSLTAVWLVFIFQIWTNHDKSQLTAHVECEPVRHDPFIRPDFHSSRVNSRAITGNDPVASGEVLGFGRVPEGTVLLVSPLLAVKGLPEAEVEDSDSCLFLASFALLPGCALQL